MIQETLTECIADAMKENNIKRFILKYIDKNNFTYVLNGEMQPVLCGFDISGIDYINEFLKVIESVKKYVSQWVSSEIDYNHIETRFTYTIKDMVHETISSATIIFIYKE